jgi:hypothetical protein
VAGSLFTSTLKREVLAQSVAIVKEKFKEFVLFLSVVNLKLGTSSCSP